MQTTTIPLRAENPNVYLETYLLYNSPTFRTDVPRSAVIVCPGGGYSMTSDREAEPIALRFLAQGYHAFVLRYAVQTQLPAPQIDLARAIQLVREHAAEWRIIPDQIAVCGFSAGGHLAASSGVFWNQPWLAEAVDAAPEQIKPDALILGYPVIDLHDWPRASARRAVDGVETSEAAAVFAMIFGTARPAQTLIEQWSLDRHVSAATPPTFLWHTADDDVVYVQHALRFAAALAGQRVPFELHVFEHGVHGLALADATTGHEPQLISPPAQIWMDMAIRWLARRWSR